MIRACCIILFINLVMAAPAACSGIPDAMGEQAFAIVLLDYANDGSAPDVADVLDWIFDSQHSVGEFINAASYGKTTISGDVYGWITPGEDQQLYGEGWTACWPLDQDRFNLLLGDYPDVDLTAYDGFVFFVNRPAGASCAAGVANGYGIQSKYTYTDFEWIDTRVMYVGNNFYTPYEAYSRITNSTMAHEMIHALGISNHSNSYTCGDEILSTNPDDCAVQGYGDIFSIMGVRFQATLPNAVNNERLGWLDDATILTANAAGSYVLNSYEDQTLNVKALKIPLPTPLPLGASGQMDYLYLEYRAMTGFDARNDSFYRKIQIYGGGYYVIDNYHGALIHAADCSTYAYCMPYLLDMHPGTIDASYSLYKVSNAYLYEGEFFDVPRNNLRIEVEALEEGVSLTVRLRYTEDGDGDGVGDDGDFSGVEGDAICTGGASSNCDDNCPGTDNPNQEDRDGDGV
ncbi:MAG: hypothetical protein GY859_18550, partial [Desulfobacterales bacterium]|nr:hypothetical protein [Desulfobacterales bacterium]